MTSTQTIIMKKNIISTKNFKKWKQKYFRYIRKNLLKKNTNTIKQNIIKNSKKEHSIQCSKKIQRKKRISYISIITILS